jgi:hypothetical protein
MKKTLIPEYNQPTLIYPLKIMCWTLSLTLILSWSFWVGERSYPKMSLLFGSNNTLEFLAAVVFIGSLLLLSIAPTRIVFLLSSILALTILTGSDINRVQLYVWTSMALITIAAFSLRSPNHRRLKSLLILALAASYFWLGLNKFNPTFDRVILPWFLSGIIGKTITLPAFLGYGAVLFESGCGILLLSRKTRIYGAIGLIGMHLFILLCIGPLGLSINKAVWPWNIGMSAFLAWIALSRESRTLQLRKHLTLPSTALVIIIFGLLPAFNWLSLWPDPFSFLAYSGSGHQFYLELVETDLAKLPTLCQQIYKQDGKLNLYSWINKETEGGPFSTEWVAKRTYKDICEKFQTSDSSNLVILDRRGHESKIVCSKIDK